MYSLYGYESNAVLTHEKQFSKQEFEKMCKEAPVLKTGSGLRFFDEFAIKQHLITAHEFKEAIYAADFFTDGRPEGLR